MLVATWNLTLYSWRLVILTLTAARTIIDVSHIKSSCHDSTCITIDGATQRSARNRRCEPRFMQYETFSDDRLTMTDTAEVQAATPIESEKVFKIFFLFKAEFWLKLSHSLCFVYLKNNQILMRISEKFNFQNSFGTLSYTCSFTFIIIDFGVVFLFSMTWILQRTEK